MIEIAAPSSAESNILRPRSLRIATGPSPVAREWRRYDRMLGPSGLRALDGARLIGGERVLDVGCGAGGLSISAGHRVGRQGRVIGIDLDSEAVAVARSRAREQGLGWASFAALDLSRSELPQATFDAIVSRYGIATLANPAAALLRFRRALVSGGRLAFVTWGPPLNNEWFSLPRAVLAECLGARAASAIAESAQGSRAFALSDRELLEQMLVAAGFGAVEIAPFDLPVWIGDDAEDAVELFYETEGRPLDRELDDKAFELLTPALVRAFQAHERPDGVWLCARAWTVSARSQSQ